MPNHIHGILILTNRGRGEAFGTERFTQYENHCPNASPLQPRGTTPGSVGAMIQNFKSISAQQINRRCQPNTIKIWQRNYYKHIVRNEESLQRLRQYIQNNPLSWQEDQLHPDVPSKRYTNLNGKHNRSERGAGVEPLAGGAAPTPPSAILTI